MKVLLVHDKQVEPVRDVDSSPEASTVAVAGETPFLTDAGGLGIYIAHVDAALRARGCDVSVVAFRPEPRDVGRSGWYELKAFRYRLRLAVVSRLAEIVEREQIDVVHLHSMPTLHRALVRRLQRLRPVVWSFHDVTPFCFRSTQLRPDGTLCDRPLGYGCVTSGCYRPGSGGALPGDLARIVLSPRHLALYRGVPVALVPSRYLAELLVRNGFERERVRVVPLFSRFRALEAPPAADAGVPRLLFVGRLTEDKGVLALIDALGRLRELAWTARFVGDGPAGAAAKARAARAGLTERIEFPGAANGAALAAEFEASDAVVVPSLVPESFGLVGVEAMGFGRPVVAFDAGGITEWLADGVTGCLARRGDVADLAAKLARLLEDAALRARFGRAGHTRAREEFSLERHVERLLDVYESQQAATPRSTD